MSAINKRALTIEVDGTQYENQVFSAMVTSAEADGDMTLAEAAQGGKRDYILKLTMTMDPGDSTSLWNSLWNDAGSDVAVVIAPYGNATPSATQPHFSMLATITEPDGDLLGVDTASASPTERGTVEVEWKLAAKPTRVTT